MPLELCPGESSVQVAGIHQRQGQSPGVHVGVLSVHRGRRRDSTTCDQLWFIPSSSADPRTVYVKFATMDMKRDFDALASKLGWKPEKLGEKLLLDFMETVQQRSYRGEKHDSTEGRSHDRHAES